MINLHNNNILIGKKSFFLETCFLFFAGCLAGLVFINNIFIPLLVIALNFLYICSIEKNNNLTKIFVLGLMFGLGKFAIGLYWIAVAFEIANYGSFLLGFFAVFLLSLLLSFFTGFSCVVTKLIGNHFRSNRLGLVVIFATLLSLGEYLRGIIFGGFPWNSVGYIWSFSHYTLQGVTWLGIYGLGLLTYLALFSPLLLGIRPKYALFLVTPLILLFLFGTSRLLFFSNDEDSSISIRIVQPSINQKEKLNINLRKDHFQKLVNLSKKNLDKNQKTIIIWPESAIDFDLEDHSLKNRNLFSWIEYQHILISGATRRKYDLVEGKNKLTNIYNSIFVIGRESELYHYYDKKHLVPFGEFIPLRHFFNIENLVGSQMDFTAGKKNNIYSLPKLFPSVALLVCYEIIFPGEVIQGDRPDVIINLTNDAWYGNTAGPRQHLSAARARAIEEGLPVLRSANTGISAVIDSYGRYKYLLNFSREGVIESHIPQKIKPTFFSVYGNFPFFILCILILFLARLFRT